MPYEFSERGKEMLEEVTRFLDDHIYPNEVEYDEQDAEVGPNGYPPIMDKLKAAARERGLWNLFLPHLSPDAPGTKLSALVRGRSQAAEVVPLPFVPHRYVRQV